MKDDHNRSRCLRHNNPRRDGRARTTRESDSFSVKVLRRLCLGVPVWRHENASDADVSRQQRDPSCCYPAQPSLHPSPLFSPLYGPYQRRCRYSEQYQQPPGKGELAYLSRSPETAQPDRPNAENAPLPPSSLTETLLRRRPNAPAKLRRANGRPKASRGPDARRQVQRVLGRPLPPWHQHFISAQSNPEVVSNNPRDQRMPRTKASRGPLAHRGTGGPPRPHTCRSAPDAASCFACL